MPLEEVHKPFQQTKPHFTAGLLPFI
jgi:hypothetical protein